MAQQTGATTTIPTTPPPSVTKGQTTPHHHHQHVETASFIVTEYFRPLLAQEQPPVQEPAAPADDVIG